VSHSRHRISLHNDVRFQISQHPKGLKVLPLIATLTLVETGPLFRVRSGESRLSGILETTSFCNADMYLPSAQCLVHETTRSIYANRLLKVGLTVTCPQDGELSGLGGCWFGIFADWVSNVSFTSLLRPAISHRLHFTDGPSKSFATVSCRSRKAVAHGETQRSSPISVSSKSLRERLYVLDFRSSCPNLRVFLIHRLTYIPKYEDLNYSR